jgi:hypothetical protein
MRRVLFEKQQEKGSTMKRLFYSLTVAVAAASLVATVYAGPCCDKAVAAAKEGKACVQCVKSACCKEAIKKIGDEAKPDKCSKKGGSCPSCPK